MGKIITAECEKCNRLFNFDIGIGNIYKKEILMDISNSFNLLNLFKENKRKNELSNLLLSDNCFLKEDYGHSVFICDTCSKLYSRFSFSLINSDNNVIFEPIFKCHDTKRTLRKLSEDDLLNNTFKCPYCNNNIKFHISGYWN